MFQFRPTKSHIAIILFTMVACLVGRNFVANATFSSANAKPRACAISNSQIDVCKEINKKQGEQQHTGATVPVLQILPPVPICLFHVDPALSAFDNKEISDASPPRAPPLISC